MNKIHTTLSVDDDILAKAKAKFPNVSFKVEQLLAKELKQDINQEEKERTCFKCEKHKKNLLWLDPDWKWICQSCLTTEVRKITTAVR